MFWRGCTCIFWTAWTTPKLCWLMWSCCFVALYASGLNICMHNFDFISASHILIRGFFGSNQIHESYMLQFWKGDEALEHKSKEIRLKWFSINWLMPLWIPLCLLELKDGIIWAPSRMPAFVEFSIKLVVCLSLWDNMRLCKGRLSCSEYALYGINAILIHKWLRWASLSIIYQFCYYYDR
jgi:hypothetical protein